jgi:general secretion pathway protein A
MYAQFFGLKQEPFSIAPDPRYLFMSDRHREALAHLLYGVNGGGGFVLLSGEIGAGKTTVCRCFLEQIPRRCNVAYIFNPKLTAVELLRSVCEEFGIPQVGIAVATATVKDYLDPLNEFLLRTHAVGQNNVLIIDEAQMLSAEVLEQLRLLTNLETNERKLLQIVLIGQPELRDMLARPELEQLAQRVIARYHLGALTESETQAYIRHRLAVAGMTIAMPFDGSAMQRIHQLSRGIPRRINLLCDRALLGAYALGKGTVDREIVDKAAVEVFGRSNNRDRARARRARARRRPIIWGFVAAGAFGALLASAVLVITSAARHRSEDGALAMSASPKAASAGRATVGASAGASPGASEPASGGAGLQLNIAQAASAATFLTASDLQLHAKSLFHDERDAWRELAVAWNVTLDNSGDPCVTAQHSQLECFRSKSSTLAMIRQLDRPGILTLQDASDKPVYAVLTGLTSQTATLRIGAVSQTVSLVSLATLWRGDFDTFWRAPSSYSGKPVDSDSGAIASWTSARLDLLHAAPAAASAAAGQTGEAAWKARISAFQLSQGLKPDGLVGPTTFMQLNRATGVDEPRLRAESSAS